MINSILQNATINQIFV